MNCLKLIGILFLTIALHGAEDFSEVIRITGATTIQPILEKLAASYTAQTSKKLQIEGGGSETGLTKLSLKETDIAMVVRNLTADEKNRLAHLTIGYDAVAIIYHKSQSIRNLTKKEIIGIYDGTIKDWRAFGYPSSSLIAVSRKVDRGTLPLFETYTGLKSPNHPNLPAGTKLIRSDAWEAEANINTLLWVAGLQESIGYVSYGEAKRYEKMGYPIRISALDGVNPSEATIRNGMYPIRMELNLVWDKKNPKAEDFIRWIKISALNESVRELGFVVVK
ncbi:MAG: substrate-binding domain-containing protein [Sulfuricurvum sp.]|nr:substrate-binding domain-containing protein [Sulfuricurvum sp.]